MPAKRTELSETELEVLKALWDQGSATVRELSDHLEQTGRTWAYTTVLTFVGRLEAKGYVKSDKSGVAHVFRPVVSRDGLLRQRLTHLAQDLCNGTATPLVQALVAGRRFTPDEISHFRRLLDDLEQAPRAANGKQSGSDKPRRGGTRPRSGQ